MSSDWIYCVAGVGGSFLISLFFYWIGGYEKLLLVDLAADHPLGASHNCACMLKNIGRKTIYMKDFAPNDQPHVITNGAKLYGTPPPDDNNINNVRVQKTGNDVYVTFDYLLQSECVTFFMCNVKGSPEFKATQIEGKMIDYQKVKGKLKILAGITSLAMISGIAGLLIALKVSKPWFFGIVGLLVGYCLITNYVKFRLMSNHNFLEHILRANKMD